MCGFGVDNLHKEFVVDYTLSIVHFMMHVFYVVFDTMAKCETLFFSREQVSISN